MDTQRESRLVLGSDVQVQIRSTFAHFARKPRAGGTRTIIGANWPAFRRPESIERRSFPLQ